MYEERIAEFTVVLHPGNPRAKETGAEVWGQNGK